MTLVVPDTFQVAIEMTQSGQTIFNVIGVRVSLTSGLDSPMTNLGKVKDAWEQSNGPMYRHLTGCAMVGYHYTDLRSTTGATAFLGSSATGGTSGEVSTMAACAVVKLSGDTRSRSEHGRLFHGPLHEGAINADGRTIESTTLTNLASSYNLFRTNLISHDLGWAVISRKLSTSKDVASLGVASIIGTQRRRIR
jgi:hypothetical protein